MQSPLSLVSHYVRLAVKASRQAPALTTLIVLAVAVGIGACMSMLTLQRAMSRDPIPAKSSQLFVPQFESRPLADRGTSDELPDQLSLRDARELMRLPIEARQTAMYPFGLAVTPADANVPPFRVEGRATTATFFGMFDAPFQFGSVWDESSQKDAAAVAVLSARLNERLFGGVDSVGRVVRLGDRDYRVIGVLREWKLLPRIYDLVNGPFADVEDIFIPLTTALDAEVPQTSLTTCPNGGDSDWQRFLNSDCLWIQYWVELRSPVEKERYRSLLQHYAVDQQRSGRFVPPVSTELRDAREWARFKKVVPNEIHLLVLVGFAFLAVCLLNAVGLILARFESRATEFGVRRALGAARRDVLTQCLTDAAVSGVAGGIVGLLFTVIGLNLQRMLLPHDMKQLAYLDVPTAALVICLALIASLLSALYPAWRASRVEPALVIKSE